VLTCDRLNELLSIEQRRRVTVAVATMRGPLPGVRPARSRPTEVKMIKNNGETGGARFDKY
jgi:GT2 family glycosyltransferase